MVDTKMKWLIAGVALLIFLFMGNTIPKEAVADLTGESCTKDTVGDDCPCWGKVESSGIEAYGIGVGRCIDNACDMTYCIDVEPIGEWGRDHPWAWMKDPANATMLALLVGLLLVVIFWPKD